MLPTFIGLVIFSVGFVFSVSNTKYHILCSEPLRHHLVLLVPQAFLTSQALKPISLDVGFLLFVDREA